MSGPGAGEWIEADFGAVSTVDRVVFDAGWNFDQSRDGDLFPQNSHLRHVRVYGDQGRVLADRDVGIDERTVSIGPLGVRTRTLRIEATDVWPGTRWEDFCISEVTVEGRVDPANGVTLDWERVPGPDPDNPDEFSTRVTLVAHGSLARRSDLGHFGGACHLYNWINGNEAAALSALNCVRAGGESVGIFGDGSSRIRVQSQGYSDGMDAENDPIRTREVIEVPAGSALAVPVFSEEN